ncbi:hypothetical protein SVIO_014290 [Streptomyces violaceusniger]|uniref:AMP-dependent synthetase/ligase domain-containing protein n=1 Tax=Streptomyces violaceusniger TaxID=68280 RepID=A0A4D4KVB5_STRVO|nr:hypothetical protein SVIO_014290 [Streptomyces violaceusniger]
MDTSAGASGHRSPHHDAEPITEPFPQALLDAFRARPELPAFEHRSRVLSRGEVLELIGRCADGLRAAGLGPGRSVAVATDVTPEGFALLAAAYALGCRVTGLRPGMTPAHLGYVLSDGIDVLVTDETGATPELLDAAGGVTVSRLGPDLLDAHPKATGELIAQGRPDDIALVTLTSGSTGRPKGCAHSYRSLALNWAWQPARWTERTTRLAAGYERYLLFGTLSSAVIFEHLGVCLMGGGTAVIPEPPFAFPQVFERHRITACLMTVPRLHQVLDVLRTDRVDISSLRVLLVAGSPLAPHRLAEAARLLGPAVHQGYGQTETGMLTLLTPDEMAEFPDQLYDSVGRAWSGVEMDVRDPEGRPVPAGTTGEIWVRTDSAMAGYWGTRSGPGRSCGRGGCAPAMSATWTSGAFCGSPGAPGTWSSSTRSCTTPGRSNARWRPIPMSTRRMWWARPTSVPARPRTPSSSRPRAVNRTWTPCARSSPRSWGRRVSPPPSPS